MPRFEWDPNKAAANLKKHGVNFEAAKDVFLDPNALGPERDTDNPLFEERWHWIGLVDGRVLFVVVTEREQDDVIRIISARKADRRDERRYFDKAATQAR
jgi:uncharacterized protein